MEDHSLSKSETENEGEAWTTNRERGFKRKAKNESSTLQNPPKKQETDDKEDSSGSILASSPLRESTPIEKVNNDEAIELTRIIKMTNQKNNQMLIL